MSNKQFLEWQARQSEERQMAIMRQPYSNEDSGVALPVEPQSQSVMTNEESDWLDNLLGFIDAKGRYTKLIEISRDTRLPLRERFDAMQRANLVIIEMGEFDRPASDVAAVVYGNFKVDAEELFAALGVA